MAPQQEIFTYLRGQISNAGYAVYDWALPSDDTPYPFVYLGETRQTDDLRYKLARMASVSQDIHIWAADKRQRGTISDMAATIRDICYRTEQTATYKWELTDFSETARTDTTTQTPLYHVIMTATFQMKGRKKGE